MIRFPAALTIRHDEIRRGERFVELYEEREDGKLQVDYGRIHDTGPVPLS